MVAAGEEMIRYDSNDMGAFVERSPSRKGQRKQPGNAAPHGELDAMPPAKPHTDGPEDAKNDSWYSGMFSSLFGGAGCEQDRVAVDRAKAQMPGTAGQLGSMTGSMAANSGFVSDGDEMREDIDNESVSSQSVSTLGRGLGEDLKSLPSVQGNIIPGEDGSVISLDSFSLPTDRKEFSSTGKGGIHAYSRKQMNNNETVESVVEKKINNLKSESTVSRDSEKIVPFLRRTMFPKTPGRSESYKSEEAQAPDTILDSRRQLLVMELRQTVEKYGRFDVRCANITAALGDFYDESREFQQAIKLHKEALSVYSIKLGDDHQITLDAKIRLGQVQENSGDYDGAASSYYDAMSMTKALKGDDDPGAADILTKVAAALRKKGKYELATKTLKRALKTYREVLGDSHARVSSTVDAIASLYFRKASAILEEVVKLKAATVGAASKEVAASLSELATCYECAEQYSKAMKNLKKAYKIYADISGECGEKAILTLERIALIYQATGQFKKAAIAYLGVLRGRKRALGDCHPTVADTYFHLGVSLRESGQPEKAFKCMKQALNIYVGEGKDMHDVEMIAEVMHELAIIHKSNNNMNDAIKTFKQEIAVRRKLGQPEYPLIAQTLNHLGVAEFEIKNHDRALNYFMEALTIYEKRGNDLGTDFAEVLYNTGLVFESIRNKQRAFDAFLEAARIFKENGYNESHPHLSKAVNKLRRMGHTCRCRDGRCSAVPCESLVSHRVP
jgi:tetratricopeptide (TPR) repeat protein